MTFRLKSLNLSGVFIAVLILAVLLFVQSTLAQVPDIYIKVGDTLACSGARNTVISIFMDNQADTIAGFNLWLRLDRPDIMAFQADYQTIVDTTYWDCVLWNGSVCLDSMLTLPNGPWDFMHINEREVLVGNVDTAGTLCSGWEVISATTFSSSGLDLNIVGMADYAGDAGVTPGIPSGQQGGVLIKILADVFDIPDTLTDRTVEIKIETDFKDHFGFSRPDGSSIAWIPQEVEDTICWVCDDWWEGECLGSWTKNIYGTDCDSIEIVMDTIVVLDTAHVKVFDGSLTVYEPICGDVDGSCPPKVNSMDLLYLVMYLFKGGPPPDPLILGDVNCDGKVNGMDLVDFVLYMFKQGPPLCTQCLSGY